jgi:hypothetical protein
MSKWITLHVRCISFYIVNQYIQVAYVTALSYQSHHAYTAVQIHYVAYKGNVIGVTAPNSYLFHYFLR